MLSALLLFACSQAPTEPAVVEVPTRAKGKAKTKAKTPKPPAPPSSPEGPEPCAWVITEENAQQLFQALRKLKADDCRFEQIHVSKKGNRVVWMGPNDTEVASTLGITACIEPSPEALKGPTWTLEMAAADKTTCSGAMAALQARLTADDLPKPTPRE